jgi:hypothetical protein
VKQRGRLWAYLGSGAVPLLDALGPSAPRQGRLALAVGPDLWAVGGDGRVVAFRGSAIRVEAGPASGR